jgi:hypothetical protein
VLKKTLPIRTTVGRTWSQFSLSVLFVAFVVLGVEGLVGEL